jgi:hypothetical protein
MKIVKTYKFRLNPDITTVSYEESAPEFIRGGESEPFK